MKNLSRRSFLKWTGGAVAAATLVSFPITAMAAEMPRKGIPKGWLEMKGQRVWAHDYPELYRRLRDDKVYPSYITQAGCFVIPDLRATRTIPPSDKTIPMQYIIKARHDTQFADPPIGTLILWQGLSTVDGQRFAGGGWADVTKVSTTKINSLIH